ncbi:hypothetical protein CLV51_11025 [Chitinophaga niastensis]|uniref:Uncharacterized protein n=1 Tax=Chitinophaga niastensis TaxID=536980 RepID=A0A2P8H9G3_CHINA|nr:hypothetical protein CLV51_11025 [Chitinophaga niastensis]
MKQYNFQFDGDNSIVEWDKVRIRTKYLRNWEDAVILARRVARRYRVIVRLTEGNSPLTVSGTYIYHNINFHS